LKREILLGAGIRVTLEQLSRAAPSTSESPYRTRPPQPELKWVGS